MSILQRIATIFHLPPSHDERVLRNYLLLHEKEMDNYFDQMEKIELEMYEQDGDRSLAEHHRIFLWNLMTLAVRMYMDHKRRLHSKDPVAEMMQHQFMKQMEQQKFKLTAKQTEEDVEDLLTSSEIVSFWEALKESERSSFRDSFKQLNLELKKNHWHYRQ